jgi:hypothetical protein
VQVRRNRTLGRDLLYEAPSLASRFHWEIDFEIKVTVEADPVGNIGAKYDDPAPVRAGIAASLGYDGFGRTLAARDLGYFCSANAPSERMSPVMVCMSVCEQAEPARSDEWSRPEKREGGLRGPWLFGSARGRMAE